MRREKLIQARLRKGLSQKAAAELIGVSRNAWSQWELGKEDPYPVNVKELCTFFGANNPDELDLEPFSSRIASMQQEKTASRTLAVFPSHPFSMTSAFVEESTSLVEQLKLVLAKPSLLEASHLEALKKRILSLWKYRDEGVLLPEELYISVHRHAQHITQLLKGPLLPTIHLRLLALACQLLTLCGTLLFDLGRYEQARDHYRIAIQTAAQAEQPTLQALASTWMSFTWTYEQRYQEAMHQVEQALSLLTDSQTEKGTFAWINAVAAEIAAQVGNYDECRTFLDQSEGALADASPQSERYMHLHRFGEGQYNGFRGVCYQLLYNPKHSETILLLEHARNALERAMCDPFASFRQKHLYRADLASAYARQGEVNMACDLAIQAIQDVDQATAKNVLQRLEEVHVLLQPWKGTPSVRQFNSAFSLLTHH